MNRDYASLHRESVVVDAHSDLITEIHRRRRKGARAQFLQVFAGELSQGGVNVVMLSTGGDSPTHNIESGGPMANTMARILSAIKDAEESAQVVSLCMDTAQMDRALEEGKIALFLMIEGARPLLDDPAFVELYYRLGIRSIQVTWNGRNLVGDGCGEEDTGGKLTRLGRSVVKEMNRLGVVVDVSHASQSTFYSALDVSEDPVIVSHANARAVTEHVRNLTNHQIKTLAEQGGVVGICFFPVFIHREAPSLSVLLDHVDHIAGLVGTRHLSIGPDYIDYALDLFLPNLANAGQGGNYGDRFHFPDEIKGVTRLPLFTNGLRERGYSSEDVAGILGGNILRIYRQVIG